ncbi:uncharacterized protein PY17X_1043500 [Plasmodium yoelii]|uniref:PIR protein n=3 Tax=Plasmodium yoelii TaxID=5861 RepID=A0AAE9WXH7_PLAYO|nr:uncharacterized protein PY17X_1043500 [Plasmodium yoelii]EAA16882.1 putative yir3 protein [Plasmodium yoelii yoelii]WBY58238.1 PIR protein [Plasmodium yoelii yoelii]CDU85264.1 YIR protein [Plasmodium yoelii]VTZ79159.1 PIR protein [Plasmodium yoelii]|eukprot:XP_725317.1 uncharacterized protein PY17X_1043500 [Plasmodium yoelii]
MNKEVCKKFENIRTNFTYQSSNKSYQIKNENDFKKYCTSNNCSTEFDKISAGCLYLFDAFFESSSSFKNLANSNINVVDYIMLWLSYILSLKNNEFKNSLKSFYSTVINSDEKYKKSINYVEGNSNYRDLIVKKHNLTNDDMDNNIISKLYDAFKLLCEMYTAFDESTLNCTNCSEKASQFVNKYEELNRDSNNTYGSSHNKILSTLSTDYNKLKDKCSNTSSFPSIDPVKFSEKSSQVTSSSSIANKLLLVLSIFGAIGIFVGISYKYSLFGFRKRVQKQYLREKIKNIKKRMVH